MHAVKICSSIKSEVVCYCFVAGPSRRVPDHVESAGSGGKKKTVKFLREFCYSGTSQASTFLLFLKSLPQIPRYTGNAPSKVRHCAVPFPQLNLIPAHLNIPNVVLYN